MTETPDDGFLYPSQCWPIDLRGCGPAAPAEWAEALPHVRARAELLATSTLRMLTGYRVGGCPVTVRPCRTPQRLPRPLPVVAGSPRTTGGVPWAPYLVDGSFVNIGCGCAGSCGCSARWQVRLPDATRVDEVLVDGAVLSPDAYRLDPGGLLVRTDGMPWPDQQHVELPDTEPGTWSVTYLPASPVDAAGAHAAGVLALEFLKACAGVACALPDTVTQVQRQGVTFTIEPGAFPGGMTGIKDVDAYISRWNPSGVMTPSRSRVTSPDYREPRRVARRVTAPPVPVWTGVDGGTAAMVGPHLVDGGTAPVVGADVIDGGGA